MWDAPFVVDDEFMPLEDAGGDDDGDGDGGVFVIPPHLDTVLVTLELDCQR